MSLVTFCASLRPARLASATLNLMRVGRTEVKTQYGTFWVDPGSHFGRELISTGLYDAVLRKILEAYLKPGDTFVDLGANEAYFSIVASGIVGPQGRVIAVEPQSRLQPVIARNIQLNGCQNVSVVKAVVSDKPGTMDLYISERTNTGSSGVYGKGKSESVPAMTLTQLLSAVESCALLKMDVEGAEFDIVLSSMDLLKSGKVRTFSIDLHDSILAKRKKCVGPIHYTLTKCGYDLIRGSYPAVYTLDAARAR